MATERPTLDHFVIADTGNGEAVMRCVKAFPPTERFPDGGVYYEPVTSAVELLKLLRGDNVRT